MTKGAVNFQVEHDFSHDSSTPPILAACRGTPARQWLVNSEEPPRERGLRHACGSSGWGIRDQEQGHQLITRLPDSFEKCRRKWDASVGITNEKPGSEGRSNASLRAIKSFQVIYDIKSLTITVSTLRNYFRSIYPLYSTNIDKTQCKYLRKQKKFQDSRPKIKHTLKATT